MRTLFSSDNSIDYSGNGLERVSGAQKITMIPRYKCTDVTASGRIAAVKTGIRLLVREPWQEGPHLQRADRRDNASKIIGEALAGSSDFGRK